MEVQILPSKYVVPLKAIAYMDTRAHKTMMNPSIFLKEARISHSKYFRGAGGKIFKVGIITKHKIGIKFFPNCLV